jgi:hypothetical protein
MNAGGENGDPEHDRRAGRHFHRWRRAAPRRARVQMLLRMANRHGIIAGATGASKTVTLQTMAQSL